MFHHIVRYFDKLEDRVRGRLSRYPILYTLIGGISIVLFWRGVWITADQVALLLPEHYMWVDGIVSTTASVIILLMTGLFVSFFVTDRIIMSGIKQEKKLVEKTEVEIQEEKNLMEDVIIKLDEIEREIQKTSQK